MVGFFFGVTYFSCQDMNEEIPEEDFTRLEAVFVRHRNALWIRADFSSLYTDYYLHLMDHGIRHKEPLDLMLKEQLAMLSLYLVTRPWAETTAWTANLRAPRLNLFVSGGTTQEAITGRIFTEDVREPDRNLFYSQTTAKHMREPRLSTMEVESNEPLHWFEQFYLQSEQRPGRAFHIGDDAYHVVVAQPDCDVEWLMGLTVEDVARMSEVEETNLLEVRRLRFHCGCSMAKLVPMLAAWQDRLDVLFENDDEIRVHCPRCAAVYTVERGTLEGYLHETEERGNS